MSRFDSVEKFDEWYFSQYPRLSDIFDEHVKKDSRVLEVGPGAGSVARRISAVCQEYRAIDIAEEVARRIDQCEVADVLYDDLPGNNDLVVAFGCLHHCGDLRRALKRLSETLNEGGVLVFSVYNDESERRLSRFPQLVGISSNGERNATKKERSACDVDKAGRAPPWTSFWAMKDLKSLCLEFFSDVSASVENHTHDLYVVCKTPRAS